MPEGLGELDSFKMETGGLYISEVTKYSTLILNLNVTPNSELDPFAVGTVGRTQMGSESFVS